MTPTLFPPTATAFDTNGLGKLSAAAACTVTEERNGAFELVLQYPVDGIHYAEIGQRCIILAKPNPIDNPQPFRVYRITRPINGLVTVYACHISYDLSGIPVSPFSAASLQAAFAGFETYAVAANPFTFWSDKSATGTFEVAAPASVRSLLGGSAGSILDVYGGEYKFDGYIVRLYNARGQNRGVTIRYGKNLTDLQQDENVSNVYTGVYAYYKNEETLVETSPKVTPAPGSYDFVRIMPLDLSADFDEAPTAARLKQRAEKYIEDNDIGIPRVSLDVSFVQLEQTREYKDYALLERVELCDTVNVSFARLGVNATAKVVKTEYNVLLDSYDSVTLGEARANLADTIAAQAKEIADAPTVASMQSALAAAVSEATQLITGNKGGYVVIHSSTGAEQPDEILVMDAPTIQAATKVWRWNKSGFGYSPSGYNGPYTTAITMNGAINADFITTGSMSAARVTAGILKSASGRFLIDLDANTISMRKADNTVVFSFDANGNLTINGNGTFSGNLSAAGGTFRGNLSAAGGTFNGELQAASGSFKGELQAASGSFKGELQAATGTFKGRLSAAGGTFTGELQAASGNFSSLDAANGSVHLGTNYISVNGVEIGYVPNAGDVCVVPSSSGGYGNVGIYENFWDQVKANRFAEASSLRYKRDVRDISEEDYGNIDAIRAVTYALKSKEEGRYIGVIAEEMEKVAPMLVIKNEKGEADSVDYSRLSVIAIREIQKLRGRVAELERIMSEEKYD